VVHFRLENTMRICDCFRSGTPVFSFEFFPPKTDEGVRNLYATISELAPLRPSFVSVTYGAGGSTRDLTVDLVTRIKGEIGLEAMAHLTCVGHSAEELAHVLDRLRAAGIENVLALRGDPPRGETQFVRPENGFGYAQELVRFIRSRYDFCLGGAGYPEGHVEAPDRETDLVHLKEKAESGIDFIITQLFFDPEDYFRFVERARAIGISLPIVPGIMPVQNVNQVERFTTMCGASIPSALRAALEAVREDERAVITTGIDWATEQCRALLAGGAPGIHFYTLNRSLSTRMVFQNLQAGAAPPATSPGDPSS
jgi:methylenetetrahydrofolate reductase (NADPH)